MDLQPLIPCKEYSNYCSFFGHDTSEKKIIKDTEIL